MSFNFNELNLSSYEISGGSVLPPGKYVCEVKSAKVEPTAKKDGSMRLAVKLSDLDGAGNINANINVYINGSAEATRIGRNELKSLLFYGGHPNPNSPSDVNTMIGLKVGVVVKERKYIKDGVEKTAHDVAAFIDPHEVKPEVYKKKELPTQAAKSAQDNLADDIPF